MMRKATLLVLTGILVLGLAADAQSAFQNGDVFVAVGNGQVKEFTPAGTLVQTLSDSTGRDTAGLAFDLDGNLYVAGNSGGVGAVSKFNNNGVLINANFITGQVLPVSISMAGGSFPALVGDEVVLVINQYNNLGALINSYTVQTENGVGPSFLDLLPDMQTVLYTCVGPTIFSYNLATRTQNPPFATDLPFHAYNLSKITGGPYAGDALVADLEKILLVAPGGSIVKIYDPLQGGIGLLIGLALSADSKSFWTYEADSGEIWQIDIATGSTLAQWNDGVPFLTGGLAIFPATPIPSKCARPCRP